MPNHCSNDLRVKGKPEEIKKFFEFARKDLDKVDALKSAVEIVADKLGIEEKPYGHMEAGNFIPYPKKFSDADKAAEIARKENPKNWGKIKDGYNNGGYEWCIKNWGTKWGMYDFSEVKSTKTSSVVSFSSAWSPPMPVILKMSEMFPSLTFMLRYYECGAGYKGMYECKGGEVLNESYSDKYRGPRGG